MLNGVKERGLGLEVTLPCSAGILVQTSSLGLHISTSSAC